MDYEIKKLRKNQIVEGTVIKVTDNELTIDLNYFTEGTMYLDHYTKKKLDSFKKIVKIGDKVTAKIVNISERDDSIIILLSRIELEQNETYTKLYERYEQKEVFTGLVKKVIKGGFLVLVDGCDVYIPFNEMDVNRVEVDDYLNKEIDFEIIEFNKVSNKVKGSRIRLIKKALKDARDAQIADIKVGDVFEDALVKKVESFGAFVALGNVDGLVHFTQITHAHIKSAKDFLKEGDKVKVVVISKEGSKIGLSIKKLIKTPWEIFAEDHKEGEKIKGVVTKIMDFGAIIKVDEQVSGLLHKNDISWDPNIKFEDVVQMHKNIELKIMDINTKARKLSLSRRHLENNPWANVKANEGENVEVTVKEFKQNAGLMVEYQGIETLIPQKELPEKQEDLKAGNKVFAKVVKFNRDRWTLLFSIKQYNDEKYREEFEDYLKNEEKVETQTLGDIFGKKLEKLKK